MHRLFTIATDGILILNAVSANPTVPPALAQSGMVTDWNNGATVGTIPELDLEIWAAAAVNLTATHLYGAVLHPFTIAGTAATSVDFTTDKITKAGHGLVTGDGPFQLTTSGTFPAGLAAATSYWVIKTGVNDFQVATSLANALAGTFVDFTTNGTGTLTYTGVTGSTRVYWNDCGLLGPAGDGAIALDVQIGYHTRRRHRPRVVAYAISATLGGVVAVSAAVCPVSDR